MSRYFTQWDSDTIGTNVAGWTVRGGGAPGRAPAYATPPVKRRTLPFTTDNTGDYRCISWDAIDADANRAKFDILVAFHADSSVEQIHLYGRGAGSVTDFYRVRLTLSGGALRIDKMAASAYTADIGTATVTITAGNWYFARFQGNGTALKAKVWNCNLGMVGEPAAWDISITDSSVTAAGWCAIGGRHTTLTGKIARFNFVAIGTNGDTPTETLPDGLVSPITNTEFATWAAKPRRRAILAEMEATGYDSAGSPYTKTVKAYVSNYGYTSHPQDSPASQHYDAYIASVPTFSREMSAALSGPVSVGFGDLVLKNAAGRNTYVSKALQFDGANDYVDVTHASSLNFGSGAFSIALWANIDAVQPATFPAVIDKGTGDWTSGTGQSGWHLGEINGADTWAFRMNDGVGAFDTITLGVLKGVGWRHIAITVDDIAAGSPLIRGYINGTQVASVARAANSTDTSVALQIGRWREYTRHLAGVLDDVRLYNRAISAAEIAATMSRRLTGAAPGLVAYWSFDENLGTTAYDATSNANNGTLTNGPTWVTGANLVRDESPGRLDDWLRVRWNRNTLTMLIGDPAWARHDFRALLVGRLGQPTAPSMDMLKFPIADMADALNVPVQTAQFTSGDCDGQRKPTPIGTFSSAVEPPLTDSATLTFTISYAAISNASSATASSVQVKDNGVPITSDLALTAVDAGTDTMTSPGHGMLADSAVVFFSGTPPAPLAKFTEYFVISAGLTTDDFRLSATLGGAAINLTSATTGATGVGYNYVLDKSAATLRLLAAPAGLVTISNFYDAVGTVLSQLYEKVMFTLAGVSLNNKDQAKFSAFQTLCTTGSYLYAGKYVFTEVRNAFDVASEIAKESGSWFGASFDGLLQAGLVDVPAATSVKQFGAESVASASLRLNETRRAIDTSGAQFRWNKLFANAGAIPSAQRYFRQGGEIYVIAALSGAGVPLDSYQFRTDARKIVVEDTIYQTFGAIGRYVGIYQALYGKTLGIYEFKTTFAALWHANGPLSIGDTISLDHPRLGWKQYTAADPASPDNTATIDARLAVVMGINVNLSAKVDEQVTLKVYRQIPGYYPTSNLN